MVSMMFNVHVQEGRNPFEAPPTQSFVPGETGSFGSVAQMKDLKDPAY